MPWDGNGWWSADGDALGAALGLERAASVMQAGGAAASAVQRSAVQTVAAYGQADQLREFSTP